MSRALSEITVFGSRTCEDTAITESRLATWAVPFRDIDIDEDDVAAAEVERLVGHRVTPTVTVAERGVVATEPTLEELGTIVAAAGWKVAPPVAVDYHGDVTTRSIPIASVASDDGGSFRLTSLRGRRQALLFLAHAPSCLPCFGYARQLARQRAALDEADADVLIVGAGTVDDVAAWRHGIDPAVRLLADPGGAWKAAVAAHVGFAAEDAAVLALDRFGAPRAGSSAPEAGGLIDPSAGVEWLRFVALDCPECSGELPWPVG
jgi:peroxiredoxin